MWRRLVPRIGGGSCVIMCSAHAHFWHATAGQDMASRQSEWLVEIVVSTMATEAGVAEIVAA